MRRTLACSQLDHWLSWETALLSQRPLRVLQNLCFTKKIRYESRKQLAQARPRIKGQFVRMASGSEAELVAITGTANSEAAPLEALPELSTSETRAADTASPSGMDAAVEADIMADAEEVSCFCSSLPMSQRERRQFDMSTRFIW